jgi:hypothetical protein
MSHVCVHTCTVHGSLTRAAYATAHNRLARMHLFCTADCPGFAMLAVDTAAASSAGVASMLFHVPNNSGGNHPAAAAAAAVAAVASSGAAAMPNNMQNNGGTAEDGSNDWRVYGLTGLLVEERQRNHDLQACLASLQNQIKQRDSNLLDAQEQTKRVSAELQHARLAVEAREHQFADTQAAVFQQQLSWQACLANTQEQVKQLGTMQFTPEYGDGKTHIHQSNDHSHTRCAPVYACVCGPERCIGVRWLHILIR